MIQRALGDQLLSKLSNIISDLICKQKTNGLVLKLLTEEHGEINLGDIRNIIIITTDRHSLREMLEIEPLSKKIEREISYVSSSINSDFPF